MNTLQHSGQQSGTDQSLRNLLSLKEILVDNQAEEKGSRSEQYNMRCDQENEEKTVIIKRNDLLIDEKQC